MTNQFLYETIYQDLFEKIRKQEYSPGQSLPSERDLCQIYDVSLITVRKALELLEQDGVVIKHRGKGSLVNDKLRISPVILQKNIAILDVPFPFQLTPQYPHKDFPENVVCNSNNWIHTIYDAIFRELKDEYNVILAHYSKETIIGTLETTVIRNVERIFLVGYFDQELIDFLHSQDKSVLVYNCFSRDLPVCRIVSDTRSCMLQMVQKLYDMGHRTIATINGDISMSDNVERAMGYHECLIRNDIMMNSNLIKWGNMTFESGYWLMNEILDDNSNVTAVVCVNDNVAAGALYALRERGLNCPSDISIVGHDNNEFVVESSVFPELSTVDPHLDKVGAEIARCISRPIWIDDETTVKGELIIRNSIASPPKK